MVLLNYKDFLINQCANCSLFLTSENIKLTNVKHSNSSNPLSNSDHSDEISNTDAISYVYGLSIIYLNDKLKSYFIEQDYECEHENTSQDSDKYENMESTVLALCEKCGSVFEDLYKVSKLFRNLSDKSSLIWKILEERGFQANIEENESEFDIKEEDANLAVSNEEDLNRRVAHYLKSSIPAENFILKMGTHSRKSRHEFRRGPIYTTTHSQSTHGLLSHSFSLAYAHLYFSGRSQKGARAPNVQLVYLDPWNECENSDLNFENEFKDIESVTGADVVNEKLNSEDCDSYEEGLIVRTDRKGSSYAVPSTSIKRRLRKRKQNLEPSKLRKSVENENYDGIPKDTRENNRRDDDSGDENDEKEDDPTESLNENCSEDNFSPPVSEESEQSDDECLPNSKGKGIKRKGCSRRNRSNNHMKLGDHYEKVMCGESSSKKDKHTFKCKECSKIYSSRPLFHRHFIERHFKGSATHLEKIPGPPFKCPKCDMCYKGYLYLERHCARRHNLKVPCINKMKCPQQNSFKCAECDTFYDTVQGFLTHQKRKHSRKYYSCYLCREIFPLQQDFKQHKKLYHSHSILQDDNNAETLKSADKGDEQTPPIPIHYCEELYFCRTCNFKFYNRYSLLNHQRTKHDGIQKYDCKICDTSFGYVFALLDHLADTHKEYAKPDEYTNLYICTEGDCEKSFYRREAFNNHQKESKHSTSKIMCPFCEECFAGFKSLARHKLQRHEHRFRIAQRYATNKKTNSKLREDKTSFKCWFCDETFANRKDELRHRNSHPKEEQVYNCTECNLYFSTRHQWYEHNMKHRDDICKDYQCETCGRKLNGLRSYRLHCRLHAERSSGKRPVCEICGKSYSTSTILLKHKNIMHDRRQEKTCHLCGHVSQTMYNLRLHLKVHEKNGIFRNRTKK